VAGVLIGWVGEGLVFALNAVSYLAVLAGLAALELPRARGTRAGAVLADIRAGFAYAFDFPPIRDLLLLLGLVSLVGVPYVVLLPVFARDVLAGDAGTLGLLTSSAGLGALVAALTLASRDSVRGLGRVIARATVLFGSSLVAFALSRNLWLSCAMLVATGFGVMMITASINTVLQTLVSDAMRGRIMSLYAMGFVGMTPIGSLAGGALAGRIGAPLTLVLGGAGCIALAAWFWRRLEPLRALVLPVYERLGVVPEVAKGLQTASALRPRS
jgi:MFS family permease